MKFSIRHTVSVLLFILAFLPCPVHAQPINTNPNSTASPEGTQGLLLNASGVTGYRSAAEYLTESEKEEQQERAERERRLKAMENYGDPLAPVGQSFGQSYTRPPYNGR